MSKIDISGLREEFDSFVKESCAMNPEDGTTPSSDDKEDDEYAPQFVDALKASLSCHKWGLSLKVGHKENSQ
jgi:hypothetical protein